MRINLVMSGGGTRLPAYVGAVTAVREMGAEIARVAGVSGGSVVGAFLAAGFSDDAMRAVAVETEYRQFVDISLIAILAGNGLCAGRRFERWLDGHLRGACFRDLPMEFHVVATDILEHKPVIFSPTTTPDVRVSEAVRYSMAIPGYFACSRWRGHVLVDGGLVPSALWNLFDGTDDTRTIYVLLESTKPPQHKRRRVLWTWNYASLIVRTLLLSLESGRVPAHLWKDTALIKTGAWSAVDFKMSPAEKMELLKAGYDQVRAYLPAKSGLFATP